jgi:hypothetical protein
VAVSVGGLLLCLTDIVADDDEQRRRGDAVPKCRTDGRIRADCVEVMEFVSPGWNHLNVRGCDQR